MLLLQKQMRYANPEVADDEIRRNEQAEGRKATSFFQSIKMSLSKVNVENKAKVTLKQVNSQNIDFLQEMASSTNFESHNPEAYICVLFDLLLYKYPVLSKGVFELLVRLFTRKRTLLESLQSI